MEWGCKCCEIYSTSSFVQQFHNSALHELININGHHFIVYHCEQKDLNIKKWTKLPPCLIELYNEDVMVLIWIGFLPSDGD